MSHPSSFGSQHPQSDPYATQPQWGSPPPPPKKKRRVLKWLLLLLVAVLFLAMCSAMVADNDPESGGTVNGDTGLRQTSGAVGDELRSGGALFVAQPIECGIPRVGSSDFGVQAQGEFCKVPLRVTNVGDSAMHFMSSDAKLVNDAGQKYDASAEAAIYDPASQSIFEPINPGNTLEAVLYFDVPAGMTPTYIELSGGFMSEPATARF